MVFSWVELKKQVILRHQRQNRTCAKGGAQTNPDFAQLHPDWCRDATGGSPSYTLLNAKVKENIIKLQKLAMDRRNRIDGKE